MKQYSPAYAAIGGSLSVFLAGLIRKPTRMKVTDIMSALKLGALDTVQISAACACAGIIFGVVTLTGVGLKLSSFIMDLAAGKVLFAVLLGMGAGIILSMTMTMTADYIIMAILIAPALIKLGLDQVTAHLIVLWSTALSNLTPPLALAAYTAAGLAKADPIKTALYSMRIGKAFFLIPLFFVYSSILSKDIWVAIVTGTMLSVGFITLEAALKGYFIHSSGIIERIILFAICLLLFWQNPISN